VGDRTPIILVQRINQVDGAAAFVSADRANFTQDEVMKAYQYLMALLLPALIINENLVQWAIAVVIGDHNLISGFQDAFQHFNGGGYLVLTAFRLLPYVCLGVIVAVLSKTRFRNSAPAVLIGGLVGILAMILLGSWVSLSPIYTGEPVTPAIAIAFVWIPIYAVLTGAIGAVAAVVLQRVFRVSFKPMNARRR
jgi:hypothetical protein